MSDQTKVISLMITLRVESTKFLILQTMPHCLLDRSNGCRVWHKKKKKTIALDWQT